MDPEINGPQRAVAAPPAGTDRETPAASDSNNTHADSNSSSNPSSSVSVADNAGDADVDLDASSSQKAEDILTACKWRDIGRLRSLAEGKGGLLTDALRRRACKCP